MGLGSPDPAALDRFFRALPATVARELESPAGIAYDRLVYSVSAPLTSDDARRVLETAGAPGAWAAVSDAVSDRQWASTAYPELARSPPDSADSRAWSAILHFHDPSYPLFTRRAHAALRSLGFPVSASSPYADYVAAVDDLKERCPPWAVPETHWFLSRILQVGLHAWQWRPRKAKGSKPVPDESTSDGTRLDEGCQEC